MPRLIKHIEEKDKKRKALVEDIMSLYVLLDEHKCEMPTFVAQKLRKVPQLDPGSVDMCFLLETVSDLKAKVDMLDDLKKKIDDIQVSVQTRLNAPANNSSAARAPPSTSGTSSSAGSGRSSGLVQDTNLQVKLPPVSQTWSDAVAARPTAPVTGSHPASSSSNGYTRQSFRVKPTVGSKNSAHGSGLKASTIPRQVHLFVGNLDVNTTKEEVAEFVRQVDPAIRLHHNELIRLSRYSDLRCISAHISVSGIDKEKVLNADLWPEEVTIRPWKFFRNNARNE